MSRVSTSAAKPDVAGVVNYSEVYIFAEDAVAGSGSHTANLLAIPANARVLRGAADIEEAFDAGTTNVLIVGDEDDDDHFLAAGDVNEAATGVTAFASNTPKRYTAAKTLKAKYSYTGTAPTIGRARVWCEWVRPGE